MSRNGCDFHPPKAEIKKKKKKKSEIQLSPHDEVDKVLLTSFLS